MSDVSNETIAPLFRVPVEIRLAIYRLVTADHEDRVVRIRTEPPSIYEQRRHERRRRCTFRFNADRIRSRCAESTYYFRRSQCQELHTAVLAVNHKIHAEASHVLYAAHTFDFDMDIEAMLPFLQDLAPASLSAIRRIRMVKRSLPYTKDFDRCEWRSACSFIAESMRSGQLQLKQLDLDVSGGMPSMANKPALTYSESDFGIMSELEEMEEDMEWVRHVVRIQGLQVLNVRALFEHCPIPGSKKMEFFVKFSASIEKGFTDYLKSIMFPGPS